MKLDLIMQPFVKKVMCRNEIKFAVGYFANKLLGPRLAKNIHLELSFIKMNGQADGYCNPVEHGRNPRSFEIVINASMPRYKQLIALAHEMVHLKQYARNELQSDTANSIKWSGKVFRVTNSFEDYLEYPWEIEAFGRERGLYVIYAALLHQEKIKFRKGKMYMRGKYFKMGKA